MITSITNVTDYVQDTVYQHQTWKTEPTDMFSFVIYNLSHVVQYYCNFYLEDDKNNIFLAFKTIWEKNFTCSFV